MNYKYIVIFNKLKSSIRYLEKMLEGACALLGNFFPFQINNECQGLCGNTVNIQHLPLRAETTG